MDCFIETDLNKSLALHNLSAFNIARLNGWLWTLQLCRGAPWCRAGLRSRAGISAKLNFSLQTVTGSDYRSETTQKPSIPFRLQFPESPYIDTNPWKLSDASYHISINLPLSIVYSYCSFRFIIFNIKLYAVYAR